MRRRCLGALTLLTFLLTHWTLAGCGGGGGSAPPSPSIAGAGEGVLRGTAALTGNATPGLLKISMDANHHALITVVDLVPNFTTFFEGMVDQNGKGIFQTPDGSLRLTARFSASSADDAQAEGVWSNSALGTSGLWRAVKG